MVEETDAASLEAAASMASRDRLEGAGWQVDGGDGWHCGWEAGGVAM